MRRQQPISTRYEVMLDPLDRFMVWDTVDGVPAAWAGEVLAGLNRLAALAAADLLNSLVEETEQQKAS